MRPARLPSLLGVLFLPLFVGCDGESSPASANTEVMAPPQAPEIRVEVARIGETAAGMEISLPGEITGARDAVLGTAMGGFVEDISVEEGQAVRAGQVLARVNTSLVSAQLEQAEAQAALAKSELRRVEALGDLASEAQIEGARTQAAITEAGAKLARIQVSRSTIKAPFNGVVAQIDLEEGEIASPSAPVARVVELDPVHVTLSVSDRYVGSLSPGEQVVVSAAAVGLRFEGTIRSIDAAADLRTRTFQATVEVANPDHSLLPGMIASVLIQTPVSQGAVLIPQDWLVTRSDGVGVFLEQDGTAHWRPVQTGQIVVNQVVVTEGLSLGDRLVVKGHRDLVDGDPLLIAREGVCCTNGRAQF